MTFVRLLTTWIGSDDTCGGKGIGAAARMLFIKVCVKVLSVLEAADHTCTTDSTLEFY